MHVIVSELKEVQRKYGDDRRTEIDLSEDLEVEDADLIPEEDVIVTDQAFPGPRRFAGRGFFRPYHQAKSVRVHPPLPAPYGARHRVPFSRRPSLFPWRFPSFFAGNRRDRLTEK